MNLHRAPALDGIQPIDLISWSRMAPVKTTISIYDRVVATVEWIRLRAYDLTKHDRTKEWMLRARLGPGHPTDGEHDSAIILCLRLSSVALDFIDSGSTYLNAVIAGDSPDGFNVPTPDYDPYAGAVKCRSCRANRDAHQIVDSYIPPVNVDLWNLVRGRRIEILTGPEEDK